MGTTNNFWQTSRPAVAIDKQRAYITLPAFSSTFEWRGVPTIVLEYQYAATNNFTVTGVLPAKPTDANFTLCIKYRIGSTVYRYKLWNTEGQLSNTPLYAGEVIKKNFTLEVWSSGDDSPVVLSSSTNFYLSIKHVRATLQDGPTYLNANASAGFNQDALVNTNNPSGGSTGTLAQGGDPANLKVFSDGSSQPRTIRNSAGIANCVAGTYEIRWVKGVYSVGGNIALWTLGLYNILNLNTNEVLFTFGNATTYGLENLAIQANEGFRYAFTLLADAQLKLANTPFDASNIDGADNPTFKLVPVMTLPLTYTTTQHGISN